MSAKASSAGSSDLRPSRSFEFLGRRRDAVGFHAAYKCATLEESGMADAGPGEPKRWPAQEVRQQTGQAALAWPLLRFPCRRPSLGRPARKTQWISQGF
jgi:hypothetical protein